MSTIHTYTDPSFDEIMAAQMRRAPWLGLSLVLHALMLFVLMLVPRDAKLAPTAPKISMKPQEDPIDVEEPEDIPDEKIVDEKIDEVTLDEPVLDPVDDVESPVEADDVAMVDAAFDSTMDNSAIGMGGNAGGPKYGSRGKRGGGKPGGPLSDLTTHALTWLALHQDDNGQWDADEFMKHDLEGMPCDGAGNGAHDVGVTGLALLAFLGDGSTMNSGAYRDVVKDAVRWLRDQQDPDSGLIGAPSTNEFVYDHAIATLALVEAAGLSRSKILRPSVQKALDYLERHRNPYAGWRYQPRDGDTDMSVTGWCILAYKSAQDFDFTINKSALDVADAWMESVTDPTTGRTGYNSPGGLSSRHHGEHAAQFPREKGECMTAVSLLCRVFLGHSMKSDKVMAKQAVLISKKPPVWDVESGAIDHYAWYYGTYALYQIGGKHWRNWSKSLAKAVAKTQRKEGNEKGSWDPVGVWGEAGGRVYSTAILCLTAQAYKRYARVLIR